MICCTSRDSRSDSVSIRPANRRTASGSSAASRTASASSLIAPTGVFSSWETLATKSRRTVSTRRSRVRSSTSASTSVDDSGAHADGDVARRRALAGHQQLGLADLAVAAYLRDQLGELARHQAGARHQAHRVRRRAGLQRPCRRPRPRPRCCAAPTARTRRPRARRAPRHAGASRCWRSLTCQARTPPPATSAPMSAARKACVVASTSRSYAAVHPSPASRDGLSTSVHRAFTA